MIRFVNLGDQIEEGASQFAFFDTVTDRFMTFDGEHVFDSWEEFACCWEGDMDAGKVSPGRPLKRYQRLMSNAVRLKHQGKTKQV